MPLHPLHLRALTPTLHHTPQHQGRAPVSRLNVPTPFLSLARRVNQKPTSSSSSCLHPPAAPCPRCPAPAEPALTPPLLPPPPHHPAPEHPRLSRLTPPHRLRSPPDPHALSFRPSFLLPPGKPALARQQQSTNHQEPGGGEPSHPRIAAKPPTLPVLAHHPHPAKPWHLRISTRGTHYRSHFITATDDPQQHLFSPHPKPVSWSLHHNPCLAARLCSPPDLTTRTTHPRSPPYPRVDHHPAAGERSPLPVTRLNPPPPAAPLPGLRLSTRGTHQMHTPYRGEFITPRTRGTRARQLPNKSTSRQVGKHPL